ncbi:nucleocapsid [Ixcanal virus]|uniref:Nucleoprotein n=1 Tax=Ixcanal virus TaxID=1006586 RepID=F4ZCL3_9VIRU|nr:nucleocapsid [Ixcanal virus]AEB70980.1 nucleocapsid [Ixcanal virus]
MADFERLAIEFSEAGVNIADVVNWVNEFAYQGFDAKRVLELLQQRGGSSWQEDARKMIVLALTRGNKIEKMVLKMSEEGKKTVLALKKKYQLKSGNPGRDDLTLSRVAAALAGWTCQALPHVENFLPVTGEAMDALSPGFPRCLMHPSFAGLVDTTLPPDTQDAILAAHSLFLVQFSKVINPNLRGKPKGEVVASFKQPMLAAVNGGFIGPDKRRRMLQSLGVVDVNGVPSEAIKVAANKFRNSQ